MSKIQWKAEASGIAKQEATAGSIGGGDLGDKEVTLRQTGKKITVSIDNKPVLEYTENFEGDVKKPKILAGGEQALAEAFDQLRDM